MRYLPVLLSLLLLSCDRGPAAAPRSAADPTIASLVPAATDLLIGGGAADHLVAISNYDTVRPETADLPRVGDYLSLDWERLSTIRPDILITFQAPDRLPAGLRQRAGDLQIKLVNIRVETLADVYSQVTHLGDLVGRPARAAEALSRLRSDLDAVAAEVAGRPPVRTLILRDAQASGAVGTGNFLDDLLTLAGGTNVVITRGWPSLDREQLLSLDPDVILLLLSDVPAQVEASARQTLESLSTLRAVRTGRFAILNAWYTQQPGFHVPRLARQMADVIHGAGDTSGN